MIVKSLSMKYQRILLLLLFAFGAFAFLKAQETIVESLQEDRPSEGTIIINASPEINSLIGRKSSEVSVSDYQRASGYRIQFYSGNEPRRSKEEAFRRQELISEAFPDVSTYVTYVTPYWRLRVGDFRSQEEAYLLMMQITREIPLLKREANVVKDEVRAPVN